MGMMTVPQREFYQTLGTNLRTARLARRMTQRQVGARLGVTGTAISYWESATHEMSVWKLRQVERLLQQRIEP